MKRRTKPGKRPWYVILGMLSSSVLLVVSLFMLGSSLLGLAESQVAFEALAARVRALHSYETPCIVALPVARGDADFLAWITESTHPEE